MKATLSTRRKNKIAIIIGITNKNKANFDYKIRESKNLAIANGIIVCGVLKQNNSKINSSTYFSEGKIFELKRIALDKQAELVISQNSLSATQIRNIEKILDFNIKVIDRTALILDIFALRARTKNAKLQVKLAQKRYQLPRLHTSISEDLDQQRGLAAGRFTNRGSGETKLELSKRKIERQIFQIKRELKTTLKNLSNQRKKRNFSGLPVVSLVGYTNAGKSTWMNQIIKEFSKAKFSFEDKKVFQKDMLFATLDATVRAIKFPNNLNFLLSDTVGFVSDLPIELISSFQTTLSEIKNSDLLVQVVDISNTNYQEMIGTTKKTLKKIGADQIPMILIYNKADKVYLDYPKLRGNSLVADAFDKKSIYELAKLINKKFSFKFKKVKLFVSFKQGKILEQLYRYCQVLTKKYYNNGIEITANLPKNKLKYYLNFLVRKI